MGSAYEAISKVKKKIPFCKIIYFNQNIKKKNTDEDELSSWY